MLHPPLNDKCRDEVLQILRNGRINPAQYIVEYKQVDTTTLAYTYLVYVLGLILFSVMIATIAYKKIRMTRGLPLEYSTIAGVGMLCFFALVSLCLSLFYFKCAYTVFTTNDCDLMMKEAHSLQKQAHLFALCICIVLVIDFLDRWLHNE